MIRSKLRSKFTEHHPSLNAFAIIGEPGHVRTTPHYIRTRNNLNSLRGMHTSTMTRKKQPLLLLVLVHFKLDAHLRTRSDSKPFVEDILRIILLLQLLESRVILTKQSFSLIIFVNTIFFLRPIMVMVYVAKCQLLQGMNT